MGLVLVLLLITYYSNVLKCLSFYIGCGSAEAVACPSILLPPVAPSILLPEMAVSLSKILVM